jgi:hypothetical protein
VKGQLLAISESERSSAEAKGFVFEGVAFYLPRESRFPVYRLRERGNESYLYTVDRKEGERRGLVYERVAFYAHGLPPQEATSAAAMHGGENVVNVYRYRHASSGNYFLTAGKESPYVVGAFYFGSFSDSAKRTVEGVERVHKRQGDWWGGVSDFYGREPGIPADRRGWTGDWPHLKPVIGYYDQKSVSTLEKQIRQASDAGLSFFSFYWYWSNKLDGERFPEALRSFLLAGNSDRLKFSLALFAHPWDDDMAIGPSNAREVARQIVGYFGRKNYLRLPDERPVLMIGDHRNLRLENEKKCEETRCLVKALENFVVLVKDISIKAIGKAPFVQVQAAAPGWDAASGIDGVTCVVPPIKLQGEVPYPSFRESVFSPLARVNKPVSPCMLENFDERPRQDILIGDRRKVRYFVGKTDALFRHNLLVTKEFADKDYAKWKHPASRIIYLYAWNEWHEGGILEPNVESGARGLNIVTDAFQLPRSFSPCLEQRAC